MEPKTVEPNTIKTVNNNDEPSTSKIDNETQKPKSSVIMWLLRKLIKLLLIVILVPIGFLIAVIIGHYLFNVLYCLVVLFLKMALQFGIDLERKAMESPGVLKLWEQFVHEFA